MSFRAKMQITAKDKESNVILALDFPFENPQNRNVLFEKALKVLEQTHPYLCALKINHHLVLPLGVFDGVRKLVEKSHKFGLMAIMDCKANDIGSTNQVIAEYYYSAGFDALIANPFVGWEEGIKPICEIAKKQDKGVMLLVYMSHKGANEGYGQTIYDVEKKEKIPQYISFAQKALEWKADGVVVGSTYPEKIKEVYKILGKEIPIYSPGIGKQGGDIKTALKAGAQYLIVGRTITMAENPAKAAKEVRGIAWANLR